MNPKQKITLTAPVGGITFEAGSSGIYLSPTLLKDVAEAAGEVDDEDFEFTQYMHDDLKEMLPSLSSGYMSFTYEKVEDHLLETLVVKTTYENDKLLSDQELKHLVEYTQGQWSDGIGESFEQEVWCEIAHGIGVYISPWFYGQKVITKQETV